MAEELETVLRLVADGRLTPEEAGPIIEALSRGPRPEHGEHREHHGHSIGHEEARPTRRSRHLRIRVTERGRQVVNLRVPIGFVESALQFVPGISGEQGDRIREAVETGESGPILDVEDPDGGSVLITIE